MSCSVMDRLLATGRSVFTAKDFPMVDHIPQPYEIERRKRIRLSVAAYAYEFHASQTMTDAEFDKLASSIDPTMPTCNPMLDEFFLTQFSPMTGLWIHRHPQLEGIKRIYNMLHRERAR